MMYESRDARRQLKRDVSKFIQETVADRPRWHRRPSRRTRAAGGVFRNIKDPATLELNRAAAST
jgi:hypothetical protein